MSYQIEVEVTASLLLEISTEDEDAAIDAAKQFAVEVLQGWDFPAGYEDVELIDEHYEYEAYNRGCDDSEEYDYEEERFENL